MSGFFLVLLAGAVAQPVAVTLERAGARAIVRISGGSGLADARVRREGGEVIVTFDVGALAVPPSPAAVPPVDDVHVEKVATLAVDSRQGRARGPLRDPARVRAC